MKNIKFVVVVLVIVAGTVAVYLSWNSPKPAGPKDDLIVLESPKSGAVINSPVKLTGRARGNWFFEASFPVFLVDWDGLIIAQGIATAKSDPDASAGAGWMTTEFVPFEATLEFTKPSYGKNGALILKKDNPSGLPEHDDALEIPITFLE